MSLNSPTSLLLYAFLAAAASIPQVVGQEPASADADVLEDSLVAASVTEASSLPLKHSESQPSMAAQTTDAPLKFSFDRTAWREVFAWLANESGLALHVTELPGGTFTYADPNQYTATGAIDRINMFLLPDGFSLVRAQGLLSVLNLRDSRSLQRLDSIARTVTPEDLSSLDDHEVVKCFFPLMELRSSDVTTELSRMQLMTEPTALEASRQLVIIEVARKLRNVQIVLDAMQTEMASKQSLVKPFQLKHVTLEDVLQVARPHLGIETGLTHSAEFNVSSDESGKKLFISGTPQALKLFESLVQVVDVADESSTVVQESPILKSHRVRDENLTAVYEVLQTVLTGKSLRLSMEPATNSVIALTDSSTHKIIEDTIAELEGLENVFAIIPLQTIDPYFTITLLNQMFELNSSTTPNSWRNPPPPPSKNAIKIDADPAGMRLFVRGPKDKVAEIQRVVEELDRQGQSGNERVVPIFGAKAESVLGEAKSTWRGANPIADSIKVSEIETQIIERTVQPVQNHSGQASSSEDHDASGYPNRAKNAAGFVSARNSNISDENSDEIGATITPRGIVLQSNDTKALERFENHVRSLANNDDSKRVETIIYYLKYSPADEATSLLADLLNGTTSVVESSTSAKLVNGAVPSGRSSSLLGSYLRTTKDGSTLVTAGSLTVIADARLNRLICVGTSSDLELIEQYLTVIDRDTSLTTIETRGVSHVIELQHAKAREIADVIRDTYGDRVALNTEQKNAQQAQRANDRERGQATNENNIQTSKNREPQMQVAVHEVSNSIVVTAPESLFQDVQKLVARLDEQSEQAVEVIFYPSAQGVEMLRETLQSGDRSRDRSSRSRGR